MVRNNNKKPDIGTQIMEFLKKYWMIIAGLIFVFPMIKRYLAQQKAYNEEHQQQILVDAKMKEVQIIKETRYINNLDPKKQLTERQKITGSKELWAVSTKLAHDFGIIYSDNNNWYDFLNPKGYTENDVAIADALIKYRNYFDKLEKLYFQVDTNSSSLRKDILKLLDTDQLARVRKYLTI
jgi:hypothetical protein